MSPFARAFRAVVNHEGGLSLNPRDRGNWTSGKIGEGELRGTKYGIAAHAYPDIDIAGLTLAQAQSIYYMDYWCAARCNELPPRIAFDVFDAAVNHGVGQSIRFLQRAVGVADDGVIGPVTLAAAKKVDPVAFLCRFNAERLFFYADLSTFPSFGRGWCKRIAANLRAAA